MSTSERVLLWSIAAATLAMRAFAYLNFRFDSDEQQHLHVVWGWTAGLTAYRDLFDNHVPLFHILMAPLLAAVGERSDVLLWMRAPMLLFFASVLACTWVVGRRLWDERTGLHAAVLLAVFPTFFLKSLEFRNDNLWNALWMAALAVAAGRQLSRARSFAAGLLLGAALAASLKTLLLLTALAATAALARFLVPGLHARRFPRGPALLFVLGFLAVPLALGAWFSARGTLDDLLRCALLFNAGLEQTRDLWAQRVFFPLGIGAVAWLAWRFRAAADRWRHALATFAGTYCVALFTLWPLVSPRDLLPVLPLFALFGAALVLRSARPARLAAILSVASLAAVAYYAEGFRNRTAWHTTMLDQALRLTRPGEPLMDVKGETVYRRRPYFFPFETVTREKIARGLLADTVDQDVIRTRTYVAQADGPMWPPQARAFLSSNFLNMGRLRAAGQWVAQDGSFSIAIPGRYVILDERGEVRGTLDGTRYEGARQLGPGVHRFVPPPAGPRQLAVLWAPAWRRGHSPFHLRDLEF